MDTKFKITARSAFFVKVLQVAATAILGLQASGSTGVVVQAGSYISLAFLVLTVVQAITNWVITDTEVLPQDGPIF